MVILDRIKSLRKLAVIGGLAVVGVLSMAAMSSDTAVMADGGKDWPYPGVVCSAHEVYVNDCVGREPLDDPAMVGPFAPVPIPPVTEAVDAVWTRIAHDYAETCITAEADVDLEALAKAGVLLGVDEKVLKETGKIEGGEKVSIWDDDGDKGAVAKNVICVYAETGVKIKGTATVN